MRGLWAGDRQPQICRVHGILQTIGDDAKTVVGVANGGRELEKVCSQPDFVRSMTYRYGRRGVPLRLFVRGLLPRNHLPHTGYGKP